MTTSRPETTKVMDAQDVADEMGEMSALASETTPAAATSQESAVAAGQEQSSAEAAPEPTTATVGSSSEVEQDPAPIQPPIQPVSVSDLVLVVLETRQAVLHDDRLTKTWLLLFSLC